MIKKIGLCLAIITLVILAGIHERGHYAVASEILLVPLMVLWLVSTEAESKQKETTAEAAESNKQIKYNTERRRNGN